MTDKEQEELLIRLDEKMDRVLEQVKLTNGRVTALEVWRNKIVGGLIVVGTLISMVGVKLYFE